MATDFDLSTITISLQVCFNASVASRTLPDASSLIRLTGTYIATMSSMLRHLADRSLQVCLRELEAATCSSKDALRWPGQRGRLRAELNAAVCSNCRSASLAASVPQIFVISNIMLDMNM
jgi:hypothetical protein